MDNKKFAKSLRKIMCDGEKNKNNSEHKSNEMDNEALVLQELLEEKYNKLFGSGDDE